MTIEDFIFCSFRFHCLVEKNPLFFFSFEMKYTFVSCERHQKVFMYLFGPIWLFKTKNLQNLLLLNKRKIAKICHQGTTKIILPCKQFLSFGKSALPQYTRMMHKWVLHEVIFYCLKGDYKIWLLVGYSLSFLYYYYYYCFAFACIINCGWSDTIEFLIVWSKAFGILTFCRVLPNSPTRKAPQHCNWRTSHRRNPCPLSEKSNYSHVWWADCLFH